MWVICVMREDSSYERSSREQSKRNKVEYKMIGMPGTTELILIFAVLFFLFGAKKLPQFGKAIGETVRNLRWSSKEVQSLMSEDDKDN